MDPAIKNKINSELKRDFSNYSGSLQAVARYILEYPNDFGLDSIRETARKTEVSTYSLVRMSHKLGLKGFEELRAPFRSALLTPAESGEDPSWVNDLVQAGELQDTHANAARNGLTIVNHSLRNLRPGLAKRIVDIMFSSRTVFLTGVRATYSLAYYFHYVGRMALPTLQLVPRHMSSAVDELNYSNDQDTLFAITFSPYSTEVIQACRMAKSRGLKLVLLTDSTALAADLKADETMIVSIETSHYFACYSGAMAALENLLALVVERGGSDAHERIDSYEDVRAEFNAYWRKIR